MPNKNSIESEIEKILEHEPHRIGMHSDDWGGTSDEKCWCNVIPEIKALTQREVKKGRVAELSYFARGADDLIPRQELLDRLEVWWVCLIPFLSQQVILLGFLI